MKKRKDKLTEGFEKLMNDIGVTFIDVTPKKKKPDKKNQLPRIPR